MQKRWFLTMVAVISVLGTLAFVRANASADEALALQEFAQEGEFQGQSIAFPHNTHAGEYQIDCQYCHFSVERSKSAGMPPVASCMGCHTFVEGQQNPEEVAKLREYWDARQPIPWSRVYKVADHVYFPHMRHVSAGVDCATCHGNVEEIGVIERLNQPLTMGWCLSCHIDMGASIDCTVCHY